MGLGRTTKLVAACSGASWRFTRSRGKTPRAKGTTCAVSLAEGATSRKSRAPRSLHEKINWKTDFLFLLRDLFLDPRILFYSAQCFIFPFSFSFLFLNAAILKARIFSCVDLSKLPDDGL